MKICLETHDQRLIAADYAWTPYQCELCGRPPDQFLGYRGGDAHRAKLGVRCEVWKCSECDLIFPHPMPVPASLGQHYDLPPEDYFSAHGGDSKSRSMQVLIEQAEQLSSGRTLLDVGSGRGELVEIAQSRGWNVTAIEPSATFAKRIRQKGIDVIEKPVEECNLPAHSFDVVVLAAVLEHLYHPAMTIESISSVLRPGGILFVDVPNEGGLYFRLGNLYEFLRRRRSTVNLAPTFAPYHVVGFTPVSLRKLLGKYGLEPVTWRVYGGISCLPRRAGVVGLLESIAVKVVTFASRAGEMGTYMETWARRT